MMDHLRLVGGAIIRISFPVLAVGFVMLVSAPKFVEKFGGYIEDVLNVPPRIAGAIALSFFSLGALGAVLGISETDDD